MTGRGYIERVKGSTGVDIALLPAGTDIIESAAPGLEAAVQQLIVDRLGSEDANTLRLLLERLDRGTIGSTLS
jgi:DNA-binding MarR family transcriptional regulator